MALLLRRTLLTLALSGVLAAGWWFWSLTPTLTLVYAGTDTYGPVVSVVARTRASLWQACPRQDFRPNTPLGALAASLDTSSKDEIDAIASVGKSMIKAGCSTSEYDEHGFAPLHAAVLYGSPTAVKLLLELGADVQQPISPPPSVDGLAFAHRGMRPLEFAQALAKRPVDPPGNRQEVIAALSHRQP